MKSWQIFAAGTAGIVAALMLPTYESILAALAAIAMVAVVLCGFLLHPRKEIFYLSTTMVVSEPDYPVCVDRDRIAVRVEVARLWLLFLPTVAAIGFLVVTSAKGT